MSHRVHALTYLGVAAGGGAGAALRAWLSSGEFVSLLIVNGLGCLAIGVTWRFSEAGRRRGLSPRSSIALMSGLCGALTSYSAAVIVVLDPLAPPHVLEILMRTGLSVGCWLTATLAGLALGNVFNPVVRPSSDTNP